MDFLNKARASARFALASQGQRSTLVTIEKIPDELEFFPNSSDEWCNIDIKKKNTSSCIYLAKKGSVFPNHFHQVTEQIHILSGKIIIFTPSETVTLEAPAGYLFSKKEKHIIHFIEETHLICVWIPAFENESWQSEYIKNQ